MSTSVKRLCSVDFEPSYRRLRSLGLSVILPGLEQLSLQHKIYQWRSQVKCGVLWGGWVGGGKSKLPLNDLVRCLKWEGQRQIKELPWVIEAESM